MSLTESIASQCFGQVPTLSPVAAALPLTKLENMSRIRLRSQIDCSSPHARPISLDLKISSLVGRAIVTSPAIPLTAKRSTVLAGVPRRLDGESDRRTGRSREPPSPPLSTHRRRRFSSQTDRSSPRQTAPWSQQ